MQDATQLMLQASSAELAQVIAVIHAAIMGYVTRTLARAAEIQAQGQDAAQAPTAARPAQRPDPEVPHWPGAR